MLALLMVGKYLDVLRRGEVAFFRKDPVSVTKAPPSFKHLPVVEHVFEDEVVIER